MRIILNFTDGVRTAMGENASSEKRQSPTIMLRLAHKLYHAGWVMWKTTRNDPHCGEVIDRIVLMRRADVVSQLVIGG